MEASQSHRRPAFPSDEAFGCPAPRIQSAMYSDLPPFSSIFDFAAHITTSKYWQGPLATLHGRLSHVFLYQDVHRLHRLRTGSVERAQDIVRLSTDQGWTRRKTWPGRHARDIPVYQARDPPSSSQGEGVFWKLCCEQLPKTGTPMQGTCAWPRVM